MCTIVGRPLPDCLSQLVHSCRLEGLLCAMREEENTPPLVLAASAIQHHPGLLPSI